MKKLFFMCLMVFSSVISAESVLDNLKQTPASQYQLGVMRLELGAYILTQKLKDREIKGTSFYISNVNLAETKTHVGFQLSVIGRTKDVTQDQCVAIKKSYSQAFNMDELAKEIWPNLSDLEYAALQGSLFLQVKLVSKDNENFSLAC